MPYHSTLCGHSTPETVSWPFQGWPTRKAGGLWPSSTLSDTPRHTPMILTRNERVSDHSAAGGNAGVITGIGTGVVVRTNGGAEIGAVTNGGAETGAGLGATLKIEIPEQQNQKSSREEEADSAIVTVHVLKA
jgi:hypothetical protein